MATELNIHDVLSYLSADLDVTISKEKRAVWLDQFKNVDADELWKAAKLLIKMKFYGKFPKCSDMWEAIQTLRAKEDTGWSEGWEDFVRIASKYGSYRKLEASEELKRVNPKAHRALGTMLYEYFGLNSSEIGVFRAQFRQRYESITDTDRKQTLLGIEQKKVVALPQNVQVLLDKTLKKG